MFLLQLFSITNNFRGACKFDSSNVRRVFRSFRSFGSSEPNRAPVGANKVAKGLTKGELLPVSPRNVVIS